MASPWQRVLSLTPQQRLDVLNLLDRTEVAARTRSHRRRSPTRRRARLARRTLALLRRRPAHQVRDGHRATNAPRSRCAAATIDEDLLAAPARRTTSCSTGGPADPKPASTLTGKVIRMLQLHARRAAGAALRTCPRARRCATSNPPRRSGVARTEQRGLRQSSRAGRLAAGGPRRADARTVVRPVGILALGDRRTHRGLVLDQGARTAPRSLRGDLRHLRAPRLSGPPPRSRHGHPGSPTSCIARASATRCSSSTSPTSRR